MTNDDLVEFVRQQAVRQLSTKVKRLPAGDVSRGPAHVPSGEKYGHVNQLSLKTGIKPKTLWGYLRGDNAIFNWRIKTILDVLGFRLVLVPIRIERYRPEDILRMVKTQVVRYEED